jgi:hypothetical protein
MKKLVLSLAIFGFVTFSALNIQYIIASPSQIGVVNFDKDPKKESSKKTADTKDVNADTKKTANDANASAPADKGKASSSRSCCGGDNEGCSKSSPDKK